MGHGVLHRLDTECRFHCDRQPPRQNSAARPIEHDGQIDEAARHRGPHLVWPCDLDGAQQIRIDLVSRLRLRRARTAIESLYPHPPHQRLHVTTADLAPLGSQHASQHPRSRKGELQMQSVETSHDREVGFRHRARQVVHTATADAQDFRLPRNGQVVLAVRSSPCVGKPALLSASLKNRSPALARRSSRAATSRQWLVAPRRRHRRDQKHRQPRPRAALSTI
jgi:hypothetical protein